MENGLCENLSSDQIKKLNKFFKKNFGIPCETIIGHELFLKRDVKALMFLTPERHYTVEKDTVIRRGTKLKINDFDFQPLGYSNSFCVEIVNPQIELEQIGITLEDLARAVRD